MTLFRKIAWTAALFATVSPYATAFAAAPITPIQHVIIIVGENHTFDNLFGTYQPKGTQTIDNLLSKHIVNADGAPGADFWKAQQNIASDMGKYKAKTNVIATYPTLPRPYTTYST